MAATPLARLVPRALEEYYDHVHRHKEGYLHCVCIER